MRIFVTGGTGFIGSHFLKHAMATGHEVLALRRPGSIPRIKLPMQPEWLETELGDVPEDFLKSCQVFVHFAAHGVSDPANASWEDCFKWNVTEPLKLWQGAVRSGIKRFIICGSCFEYGRAGYEFEFIPAHARLLPTGAYHSSKAAATMAAIGLAIQNSLRLWIIRPFHVYGEGEASDRFWPSLKAAALSGKDFPMTSGEQIRDFTPVTETAQQFLFAATADNLEPGCPIVTNHGTGIPQSLLAFAESEWSRLKAKGRILPGAIPQRTNEVMRYVPQI